MTRLRLAAAGSLAAAAGILSVAASFTGAWRTALTAGLCLSFFLVAAGYLALSFTLGRSDGAFYGAFVSGILVRLAVLGGAVWWVRASDRFPVAPFVLGAAGGLMAALFIEIYFLQVQNRWISSTRSNIISSTTSTSA